MECFGWCVNSVPTGSGSQDRTGQSGDLLGKSLGRTKEEKARRDRESLQTVTRRSDPWDRREGGKQDWAEPQTAGQHPWKARAKEK